MSRADAPSPATRSGSRASPGVVPGDEIVRGVVAGARLACRRGAAELLEVFVEEGVPAVVAEPSRALGYRVRDGASAALVRPCLRPVRCLNGARVRIRRIAVLPLACDVRAGLVQIEKPVMASEAE